MGEKLKGHLARTWWAYLLIPAAAFFLWRGAFQAALQPGEAERVMIAMVGTGLAPETLEETLSAALGTEVSAATVDAANETIRGQLVWARSQDSDLVLFAESALFQGAESYFPPLPEVEDGWTCYEAGGAAYGVFLPSEVDEERWCLFYTDKGLEKPLAFKAAELLMGGDGT